MHVTTVRLQPSGLLSLPSISRRIPHHHHHHQPRALVGVLYSSLPKHRAAATAAAAAALLSRQIQPQARAQHRTAQHSLSSSRRCSLGNSNNTSHHFKAQAFHDTVRLCTARAVLTVKSAVFTVKKKKGFLVVNHACICVISPSKNTTKMKQKPPPPPPACPSLQALTNRTETTPLPPQKSQPNPPLPSLCPSPQTKKHGLI